MARYRFARHALCAAAFALGLLPSLALAAGGVRVEWMRGGVVLSAETLSSSGSSTASAAAPDFGGVAGQARITVTAGAVVVTPPATAPVATQTNGVRLQAGDSAFVMTGVTGGAKIAIIEATDAPASGGLPSGAATAAKQDTGNTSMGTLVTDFGAPGATVCATDTGSCTLNAQMQRALQRLTTINTTLGAPFQAGASIGNTAFGLSAATTGGCTPGGYQSAASTNATNIKASAGTFCGGMVINTTATLYYLRLYDLAAAPTCSSATGFIATIPIPASTSGNGTLITTGSFGWAFSAGIGFCLTGGGTSTDNTSAATGVFLTYAYK